WLDPVSPRPDTDRLTSAQFGCDLPAARDGRAGTWAPPGFAIPSRSRSAELPRADGERPADSSWQCVHGRSLGFATDPGTKLSRSGAPTYQLSCAPRDADGGP